MRADTGVAPPVRVGSFRVRLVGPSTIGGENLSVHLSDVRDLAARLEVTHKVAVGILWKEKSFALAVVETAEGRVLAWDGWYHEDERPDGVKNISGLPWDEWDDMPSKLVLDANRYWLADYLGHWLMPTYSVAREAGQLVSTHSDRPTEPENVRVLGSSELVAYLPVVDHDVFVNAAGSDPLV